MIVFNEKIQSSRLKDKAVETIFKGRAVSRGVAVGKVVCLYGRKRQFYRIELADASQISREIRRFHHAVNLAKNQLEQIINSKSTTKANIFDTHLLIFEDKSLLSKIEEKIKEEKINAEWAVKIITDVYIADYKKIADEHLRERYIDLEDVAERLQTALGGENSGIKLEKNSIIAAKEVKPSTLIELVESQPQAIITENGGWTSHTFILARELELPSITGVKGILRRVQTGDEVIVDAFTGTVILNPQLTSCQKYKTVTADYAKNGHEKTEINKEKAKTLDGKLIKLRANLDLPKGYNEAKKYGVDGIGLYRSEFLFNQYKGFPTETEQIEAYRKIAALVGGEGVRIRTFDLNVEQLTDETEEKEKNPALGLRAIRLSLTHLKVFRTQLRALLQASVENEISVILPMISDVAEIVRTKKILEREKSGLRKKGIAFGNLRLGAMIEVPSAILTIDEIAAESDFLCLGTNDLVQYLLAVDRDNEAVADWFRTLHPAVLRSIKTVVNAAGAAEIPVIVCGEMAGSPVYVPILIGLGVTELSMNVKSIPRVKKIITGIAFEEADEIVKKLQKCNTPDEVENAIENLFSAKWSHLFPAPILLPKK